jgi:hypothetical protein
VTPEQNVEMWFDFEERNREELEEAEFQRRTQIRDHQSRRWIGEGIESAGARVGEGLAWAGFWLGLGAVLVAAIFKWGPA